MLAGFAALTWAIACRIRSDSAVQAHRRPLGPDKSDSDRDHTKPLTIQGMMRTEDDRDDENSIDPACLCEHRRGAVWTVYGGRLP